MHRDFAGFRIFGGSKARCTHAKLTDDSCGDSCVLEIGRCVLPPQRKDRGIITAENSWLVEAVCGDIVWRREGGFRVRAPKITMALREIRQWEIHGQWKFHGEDSARRWLRQNISRNILHIRHNWRPQSRTPHTRKHTRQHSSLPWTRSRFEAGRLTA